MGYLCPVCEEPFADSQSCANHLAVTAILHGGDHEVWLDETVEQHVEESDDWESVPRAELAEVVADCADETENHEHPGEHTHSHDHEQPFAQPAESPLGQPASTQSPAAVEGLDADAQAILREARELTEQMIQHGADESEEP